MQFNRPEQADGVVLAYRRPACGGESVRLKLHGLEPAAPYEVRNLDEAAATVAGGSSLARRRLAGQPGTANPRRR